MKNTNIYLTILIIIFIGIIFYIYFNSYEISALEARQNIKNNKYVYVVDVRTQKEWDDDHLSNTISIPIGNLVSELPEKITDKNASILFVCKKGIRASGVVKIANKLGYNNVQAMIGNFKELQD